MKLYMGIYKSLYYENLLSIIINFLTVFLYWHFKFGKIIARLAAFPCSLLWKSIVNYYKFLTVFPKQHFTFGKIIARLAAFPGSIVWQGVTKLKFLVTYICPNHLKLYMGIYKSLYYENLLSIIINCLTVFL